MKQFAIYKTKTSVEKVLGVERELKKIDKSLHVEHTTNPAQVWATAPDYWPYGDSRFAAAEKIMARHFGPSQGGRPKYATTFHEDGTVTYWSVYRQVWVRRAEISSIPDAEYAAMSSTERKKILSRR